MLLCTGATAVQSSASLGDVFQVLHNDDRRAVAVVDGDRRLVGMVHEMALVGRPARGDASHAMSTAIAIHEATPIRVALYLLASCHLREATVVSPDGQPIGVFRDVDGLRWLVRAGAAA
jgi:CBS domain-containing protein